jgi:putative MATE family efflux protein
MVLGVLTSALGWVISPQVLHGLATPPDVYEGALGYLRIMFIGLPLALLTVYFGMALRGVGDALTPLLLQLPGMIVDIGLNPILIEGMFGAPRLGIEGAAIATLTANLVSFSALAAYIYLRDLPVRLRGREWRYLWPRRDMLSVILLKGIPMGLQMIVVSASAILLLGFVNAEGTAAVAAYGASTQIWNYLQMPGIAIGMGVSAMAAQNIGAGRWDRVDATTKAGMIVNFVMTGVVVFGVTAFARPLLQLFVPDDLAALEIGVTISYLGNWGFLFISATMILSAVPRANGATVAPLVIIVIAYLPGRLGAIALLKPWIGADAIWWSFPIGGVVSLVLTATYYRRGTWRSYSLVSSIEEAEEFVQSEAEPGARMRPVV